ncbi:PH domain-containing protein [uncultured Thiodictyon sp.]|uniref:PH domain-containing protein n=1 Tax=uncultured Thiodictyon sp. TaxID=1846217 RepID=UPI0025DA2952|nr:PH domain-containing protein [uncultured Thiodictyon sp.]
MSDLFYEAHPQIFRMRPLSSLSVFVIMFAGLLFVGAGRVAAPGVLEGLTGGMHPDTVQSIGILLFFLGAARLYVWYAPARFEVILVTEEGLSWRQGFMNRQVVTMDREDVRDLRVHQTRLQRLLDVGDISVYTDSDKPALVVRGLPCPERILSLIPGQATTPAAT